MKVSNFCEVGQMRRRKGISRKMSRSPETLRTRDQRGVARVRGGGAVVEGENIQAQDAEDDDDDIEAEDVGDTEGEAEDDTEDARPSSRALVSLPTMLSLAAAL